MNKIKAHTISAILILATSLSACTGGVSNESKESNESTELCSEELPTFESVTEVRVILPPETEEGVSSAEWMGSGSEASLENETTYPNEISERIISRFQNQLLEWYYSDLHLEKGNRNDQVQGRHPVSIEPGSKLYYRILNSSRPKDGMPGNEYRIECSDEEDFGRYFEETYTYYPRLDQITRYTKSASFDRVVASGSFVMPETCNITDEEEYEFVKAQFYEFWNAWAAEKASEELVSPLKNAYLMPFSVEEDGSADLCIYLEEENGTWLMCRPAMPVYESYYYAFIPGVNAYKTRSIHWHQYTEYQGIRPQDIFGDALTFWDQNYKNCLEDSDFQFMRGYSPTGSGYEAYTYEYIMIGGGFRDSDGNGIYGRLKEPKTGEFLSEVPELALEKIY